MLNTGVGVGEGGVGGWRGLQAVINVTQLHGVILNSGGIKANASFRLCSLCFISHCRFLCPLAGVSQSFFLKISQYAIMKLTEKCNASRSSFLPLLVRCARRWGKLPDLELRVPFYVYVFVLKQQNIDVCIF